MPPVDAIIDTDPPRRTGIRLWVPLVRQPDSYTCGVAALQSVLAYYGWHVRFDILSDALGADPEAGTNYHRMAAYAQAHGLDVRIFTEMSLDLLCTQIDAGTPVIVVLQAWRDDPADAYADAWDDGHYVVVVGYDSQRVYFMDPSTLGNYTYIPTQEFLTRWHDCYVEAGQTIQLHRFGMALRGAEVHFVPDQIVLMQ